MGTILKSFNLSKILDQENFKNQKIEIFFQKKEKNKYLYKIFFQLNYKNLIPGGLQNNDLRIRKILEILNKNILNEDLLKNRLFINKGFIEFKKREEHLKTVEIDYIEKSNLREELINTLSKLENLKEKRFNLSIKEENEWFLTDFYKTTNDYSTDYKLIFSINMGSKHELIPQEIELIKEKVENLISKNKKIKEITESIFKTTKKYVLNQIKILEEIIEGKKELLKIELTNINLNDYKKEKMNIKIYFKDLNKEGNRELKKEDFAKNIKFIAKAEFEFNLSEEKKEEIKTLEKILSQTFSKIIYINNPDTGNIHFSSYKAEFTRELIYGNLISFCSISSD
jgi:hypothetical protein